MPLNKKLLISDLDNTLYDWVSYFVNSFYAMTQELETILKVGNEELLDEFKAVHQEYGTTELPFSLFEIESIKNAYPNYTRKELYHELEKPIQAFNKKREETLKLYPTVRSTLEMLNRQKITIVAHTEAAFFNSYYRIVKLGLKSEFNHLYTLDNHNLGHPIKDRENKLDLENDFIIKLPLEEKKPNPKLIDDICSREGISKKNTYYVGDSLTRDISMANEAGIISIYASYGKTFSKKDWQKLVRITHWTDKDVKREEILKSKYSEVQPDYKINSFREIIEIINK